MYQLAMMALTFLAAQPPAPAGRAALLAPYLEEQTILVGRVDVAGLKTDELLRLAERFLPGGAGPAGGQLPAFQKALTQAGVKDLYLVGSLADLPERPPFLVLPLPPGAQGAALAAPLAALGGWKTAELHPGTLVVGAEAAVERLRNLKPAARPELAQALAAGGDAPLQLCFVPSGDSRRVLAETLPPLPKVLGGGSTGAVIAQGCQWAALALETGPQPALRLTVQAKDAAAAQALQTFMVQGLKVLTGRDDLREQAPALIPILTGLAPRVAGDQVQLTLDAAAIDQLAKAVASPVQAAGGRAQSLTNLKQIGVALHNYYTTYNRFPLPALLGKDGKPLLSWRVALLPYLEQDALYKEFHLDEPWDSEHNKKLIARMPAVFRSAALKQAPANTTTYLAPLGEATIWPGKDGVQFKDISDGTSNTIAIVEAAEDQAVIWTKPDDLKVDPRQPLKGLTGTYGGQWAALFADGSVRLLPIKVDPKTVWALFTRNGGEVIQIP